MRYLICLIGLSFILTSCGQQGFNSKVSSTRSTSSSQSAAVTCPCTNNANPVCGSDGVSYTNSCFANCAGVNFVMGACVTNECSKSGIVCGRPNQDCAVGEYCPSSDDLDPKEYENDCLRQEQDATFLHQGACTEADV